MSTQNWVIMTPAQRVTLNAGTSGWGSGQVLVGGRVVDNTTPGIGLNINPDAEDFEPGDVVTLVGNYVTPKRCVDDPEYILYAADAVAMLITLPWCMLESETIFAPDAPI
jgi:hypothetical protein